MFGNWCVPEVNEKQSFRACRTFKQKILEWRCSNRLVEQKTFYVCVHVEPRSGCREVATINSNPQVFSQTKRVALFQGTV